MTLDAAVSLLSSCNRQEAASFLPVLLLAGIHCSGKQAVVLEASWKFEPRVWMYGTLMNSLGSANGIVP